MLKEVLVRLSVVAFVCCLSMSAHAMADQKSHVNVPAGDLTAGLELLAKQSGAEFVYRADQLKGLRTRGVAGDLTPKEAVTQLLIGTTLQLRMDPSGAMLIAPARANTASDPSSAAGSDQTQEGKKSSSDRFLLAQAAPGQAQGNTSVEEQNEASKEKRVKGEQVQEVIVTGSRIPQAAGGGAHQPVRVYSRQDVQESGRTTVADFLNSQPDVSIATTSESAFSRSLSGAATAGQTTVQLHGLPIGGTLVLLDGRRVEVSFLGFFDLNNIPLSAVERIEVVPVGSSAIYGADALGGAVNIILRKDFTGLEANIRYGHADSIGETDGDFGWGQSWDRGGFAITGTYQNRGELIGAQRALTANADYRSFGGPDSRTTVCSPGNVYSVNGLNLPGLSSTQAGIPAGLTGTPTIADFAATAGALNKCSALTNTTLISPAHRQGAIASAHYLFNDRADLFTEVLYSHETVDVLSGDLVTTFPGIHATLAAGNPYNPFGEDVGVDFEYPGARVGQPSTQYAVRPLIGMRGAAWGSWEYEVSAFVSEDASHYTQVLADSFGAIPAALASTNPATALNPFTSGPPGTPALLQSLAGNILGLNFFSRAITEEGWLRGNLLQLPAGPLKAVFGGEYDKSTVALTERVALFGFASASTVNDRRNAYAFFTEERVPLIANERNVAGTERLAISLAARYDHSSDYGGKTTGQGGLEWRPAESLLVRGAYASSYQAPQLQQIVGTDSNITEFVFDPERGNQIATPPAITGPNANLQPETGRSRSLGIVYFGESTLGLQLSLTYFSTNIKNFIANPRAQTLVDNENLFPGAVTRGPLTPADVALGYTGGPITQITEIYRNYGALDIAGFDADIRYRAHTSFGELTPSIAVSEINKYDNALTPGSPRVSYVSQATLAGLGFAPRWKGVVAVNWRLGSYAANIAGRFVGSYKDYQDFSPNSNQLGDFWLFDANFRWNLGQTLARSGRVLSGVYLEAGAVNLFNRLPQYSNSGEGYDPEIADIRGRFLYAGFGLKW